jgi:UDP-3-O-[3-hydroxymyristoyl] glucosamine N-acyltransferase
MNVVSAVVPSTRTYFAHELALVESEEIGEGTRIWPFAHIMRGSKIGRDCNIGEQAYVETGAVLGNNVTVKNGVAIWAGVTVEDDVFLGPNCVLTNDPNPRAYLKKSCDLLVPTRICSHATIGANATIVCGTVIGRYAFIGAGTVIIRSVPDFALVVGNPGRQVGWMCVCAHKLPLFTDREVECSHCGRIFRRTTQGLVLRSRSTGISHA